ncbi:uncharacterized protein FOMMEDRAFT_167622 [Fomitiporia mediterranea MF3/22]|uniref:uncharacterized protein n=1 Tax=Fomitiporia mediterranea (strain MF3/22) TaxID=694068 RepID=UPI00044098A8|nr:uncharacterized protein FOMMEDRAFT_167622 [Fomitiporia mediterranea MF3/22]EJD04433.1 hypothetical protein FOMMEDRAFT_167622 [Fomitiporia mediterranea MF3/22]
MCANVGVEYLLHSEGCGRISSSNTRAAIVQGNNWSELALEIFTEWLRRTRGGPLNFTIHCHLARQDEERSEHRAFENIITMLLSNQSRWQDVDFWWDTVTVSQEYMRPTCQPCLRPGKGEQLSTSESQLVEETLPVRTTNLPSLKWFAYYGEDFGYCNARLIFSNFIRNFLPPLTVLDVAGYAAHEDTLIPALRLLNTLEELRIKDWRLTAKFFRMLTPGKHWSQKSSSLVCPFLKKLCLIEVNDPDDVGIDIEGGDETEVEDEVEDGEEMGLGDEIDNEHGDDDHWNEVQNSGTPEHRPAPHVAFIGAYWWIDLPTGHNNHQCRTIEALFRGCICVESTGHEPPPPKYLRKIATSLPD